MLLLPILLLSDLICVYQGKYISKSYIYNYEKNE